MQCSDPIGAFALHTVILATYVAKEHPFEYASIPYHIMPGFEVSRKVIPISNLHFQFPVPFIPGVVRPLRGAVLVRGAGRERPVGGAGPVRHRAQRRRPRLVLGGQGRKEGRIGWQAGQVRLSPYKSAELRTFKVLIGSRFSTLVVTNGGYSTQP